MRQAIITKYLGPTNFRGSRIKASAYAGSITINYDPGLNQQANHDNAAKKLAAKFNWHGEWIAGGMPSEDGNCYVILEANRDGFKLDPSPAETRVIWRWDRDAHEAVACMPDDMSCYAHIGQHSSYSAEWYFECTRAAKVGEYEALQRELEAAPYNYRFKVLKRHP